MKAISKRLKQTYGNKTSLLCYCADIKNMYTSLPHDAIITAIDFILDRFKQTKMGRRCKSGISIEKYAHGSVLPGYTQNNSYITLKLTDIRRICVFDIRNAFFSCFGHILKQTVGVPMGSPGSPAYAICICMYYEHIFNNKLTHLQKKLPNTNNGPLCEGLRYIDDLIAFFPFQKNDAISSTIAVLLKDYLSHNTYHPNMLLKDEPITNNTFNFLETSVKYAGSTEFHIKHKDKNVHSLLHHNKLKKVKTIHASSFAPKPQATNIILNTLHRINDNCSSDALKAIATIEQFFVATHFGYKKKHLHKALRKMFLSTNNKLWNSLTAALRPNFAHILS